MRPRTIASLVAIAFVGTTAEASEPTREAGAESTTPLLAAAQASPDGAKGFTGQVTETIVTGGYVYVRVDAGGPKLWAAAPEQEVQVGDRVIVPAGAPMPNYYSKTLDRSFDVVYFVSSIIVEGAAGRPASEAHPRVDPTAAQLEAESVDLSGIARAEGGRTVGEIFDQQDSLRSQEVVVRGRVVKFTQRIMGKNWIHMRDGSRSATGANDLTVTTNSVVAVGDTILVRGALSVDKDFGFGYQYEAIIEDASVTVE